MPPRNMQAVRGQGISMTTLVISKLRWQPTRRSVSYLDVVKLLLNKQQIMCVWTPQAWTTLALHRHMIRFGIGMIPECGLFKLVLNVTLNLNKIVKTKYATMSMLSHTYPHKPLRNFKVTHSSPDWLPFLLMVWCLIWWFEDTGKKCGCTRYGMSLMGPGVIKHSAHERTN